MHHRGSRQYQQQIDYTDVQLELLWLVASRALNKPSTMKPVLQASTSRVGLGLKLMRRSPHRSPAAKKKQHPSGSISISLGVCSKGLVVRTKKLPRKKFRACTKLNPGSLAWPCRRPAQAPLVIRRHASRRGPFANCPVECRWEWWQGHEPRCQR